MSDKFRMANNAIDAAMMIIDIEQSKDPDERQKARILRGICLTFNETLAAETARIPTDIHNYSKLVRCATHALASNVAALSCSNMQSAEHARGLRDILLKEILLLTDEMITGSFDGKE
jgi:hypothetical protein